MRVHATETPLPYSSHRAAVIVTRPYEEREQAGTLHSASSKAVVPKVWVGTQTRFAKGQKMGRAEAIQN